MDFSRQPFRDHVARLESDAHPPIRSVGENYRIEENVSAARLAHFEAETGHTNDLIEAARYYFDLHIQGATLQWGFWGFGACPGTVNSVGTKISSYTASRSGRHGSKSTGTAWRGNGG